MPRFANRNPTTRSASTGSDVYGVKEKTSTAVLRAVELPKATAGAATPACAYVQVPQTDVNYNQVAGSVKLGHSGRDHRVGVRRRNLPVVVEHTTTTTLLPSVNFKFEHDRLPGGARVAASASTMTRPDYLRAGRFRLTLNPRPHRVRRVQARVAIRTWTRWCRPTSTRRWSGTSLRAHLLAASVFSMDLDGYVSYFQVTREFVTVQGPAGLAAGRPGTDVYSDYLVSIPVNSERQGPRRRTDLRAADRRQLRHQRQLHLRGLARPMAASDAQRYLREHVQPERAGTRTTCFNARINYTATVQFVLQPAWSRADNVLPGRLRQRSRRRWASRPPSG